MKSSYSTMEGTKVALSHLTGDERRFLGELAQRLKTGISYLDFENLYTDPASPVRTQAKRLGRPISETPLYQICEDMSRRLGIQQGFLVKEEVVKGYGEAPAERRELTTGDVARLADCTHEAVRKAIRTGRLRARRIGRLSLIWEEDAKAFISARAVKQVVGREATQ
jgi:excisionase family DNA binding protein